MDVKREAVKTNPANAPPNFQFCRLASAEDPKILNAIYATVMLTARVITPETKANIILFFSSIAHTSALIIAYPSEMSRCGLKDARQIARSRDVVDYCDKLRFRQGLGSNLHSLLKNSP